MQKNINIRIRKVSFIIFSLLFIYAFFKVISPKPFEGMAEYRGPAWMDNEHIVCVKYVPTYQPWLFKFLGDLADASVKLAKNEIQIVSMDIEGKNEKVIKSIVITYPGQSPTWKEKMFKETNRITGLSYNTVKNLIAFGTEEGIIFIMDLYGKIIKKIKDSGQPRWSPDGDKLLYAMDGPTLWTWDINTDVTTKLLDNAIKGVWSPDGKKIAFSRKDKEKPWQHEVYIYDVETKKENLFDSKISFVRDWAPDGKIITGSRGLIDPHVSPDGTKLVGEPSRNESKVINFIGVCDINGENLKVLRRYVESE